MHRLPLHDGCVWLCGCNVCVCVYTQDVADAVAQMHVKGRYRELLLIVETCQAATLYSKIQ